MIATSMSQFLTKTGYMPEKRDLLDTVFCTVDLRMAYPVKRRGCYARALTVISSLFNGI